ncbi:hypothetical protein [Candidatus Nitrospira bockiana]
MLPAYTVAIIRADSSPVGHILCAAFSHAYSPSQVIVSDAVDDVSDAIVLSKASHVQSVDDVKTFLHRGGKVIVAGQADPTIESLSGVRYRGKLHPSLGEIKADAHGAASHSLAELVYEPAVLRLGGSPWLRRWLVRHDYERSWNNLGFGPITTDGSPWAVSGEYQTVAATPIAYIESQDSRITPFMAIRDIGRGAILWVNRPVAFSDSIEMVLLYRFISFYRAGEAKCPPLLLQVPNGLSSGVTMRFDCDEDLDSGRDLFHSLASSGMKPSVAVVAALLKEPRHVLGLKEIKQLDGAVLSHSVTHPSSWGGSYDAARYEAEQSRSLIEAVLQKTSPVIGAVSPFHQNPPFAFHALADAGYVGVATGLASCDPEALVGWGGRYPMQARGAHIIVHAQQCMLHGDIVHEQKGINEYVKSFDAQRWGWSIFGYLDHPPSERYQYGWASKDEQIGAHRLLTQHILMHRSDLWIANEDEVMLYLSALSHLNVIKEEHSDREILVKIDTAGLSAKEKQFMAGRFFTMAAAPALLVVPVHGASVMTGHSPFEHIRILIAGDGGQFRYTRAS